MSLAPGTRIGVYQIAAQIGVGGMGEVYQATDTNLKRQVAIKVLPASVAGDADRLARFQREAEVLAALNHPHIAAIYGLEKTPEFTALVMELVEGDDLSQRIAKGAIPIDEALPIAKQIAEALEAAHEQGIVHRDLKPANIKVRADGTVKVLDFGLAKAMDPTGAMSPLNSMSPTITTPAMTQAGMILGTAAYMAPEQAKGRTVDRRADVWAFGVVLFEMLTGTRAFEGDGIADTLGNVMKVEPNWQRLPASMPPRVVQVMRACLQKNPKQRLGDMQDVRLALEGAFETAAPTPVTVVPVVSRTRERVAWGALGVVTVLALVGFVYFRETVPVLPQGRFNFAGPAGQVVFPELSPDGRNLAFVGVNPQRIWVRPLDSLEARPIPGTEGGSFPFWSPDGENLGFFAQGKLKRIALAGGPAQTLCDAPTGRGGSWNRENVIVFTPEIGDGVSRVSADGGTPVPLLPWGRYPEFILGSNRFLVYRQRQGQSGTEDAGVFVGSVDGSAPVRVLADSSRAIYVPPSAGGSIGHLLFRREGTLMALPFDPEALAARGSAVPLVEDVSVSGTQGYGGFAASGNGVLVSVSDNERPKTLSWFDRSGKRLEGKGEPGPYSGVSMAPDGKRAAFTRVTSSELQGIGDIWLQDLERGVQTKFTFNGLQGSPVWSPDGDTIVFATNGAQSDLYRKPSNGGGTEELLVHTGPNATPTDISPDGTWLVYSTTGGTTGDDLWLLPLTGEHKPVKYLDSPFNEVHGQFSPDGKWMAYTSNESGRAEVYVQPIPATGAKRQVSASGGRSPRWRRDGNELFYISAGSKLMAVPAKLGPSGYDFGAPQQLFDNVLPLTAFRNFGYQPTADGQRFLAVVPKEGAASAGQSVTVLMNWNPEAKK